jgi:light-regulated signal transduction histidine kinase (bacteriophytochrome)
MKPYNELFLLSRIQHIMANCYLGSQDCAQMGLEIYFRGKKYFINSDRLQILNLLLSTYETAIQKNLELTSVTVELKAANKQLAVNMAKLEKLSEQLVGRNVELEAANQELAAFSYSVSHDLRAPLRSIDGFSQALLEDYPEKLEEQGRDYLRRMRDASQRMAQLIDDILMLSRITRTEMKHETVDLTLLARSIAEELCGSQPDRRVNFIIPDGVAGRGDPQLLHQVLENLLGNAWKFTGRHESAKIEFGASVIDDKLAYFVRDNGAGFDTMYKDKLFVPSQRLHSPDEFAGTGIGLSIVQRIINRHGGKVWADGKIGQGATFYFTLQQC